MTRLNNPYQSEPALPAWEPALSQLRTLPLPKLHPIVERWLKRSGLQEVRVTTPTPGGVTYRAILGPTVLSVPVHVRVYRRRNRLQAHHVDAFLGYLLRHRIPVGILVTTGECSRDAQALLNSPLAPHVRLLSGSELAAELAYGRPGFSPAMLKGWLLDQRTTLFPRQRS